jgi:hypothetical protein
MERAANESISNVDNSEEGESTSSSSAELDPQQPASTQTHSVVCWNIQCPDCPSPIARITPWPRPSPLVSRQLTPEDRRAAFALASLRGADPIRSEEITRATGSRGSLVSQVAGSAETKAPDRRTRNASLFRRGRSCPWNAADAASKAVFQLHRAQVIYASPAADG